jgi:hypothetical protein
MGPFMGGSVHVLQMAHSFKDTLKMLFEKEKMLPFRNIPGK